MTKTLHARVRRIRERTLIRAWEYRQRHHSKGVWFRLRRVLVDAGQAFIISPEQADQLEAAGHLPLPVGQEIEPQKRMFFISAQRLSELSSARSIRVGLCAELLESRNLALVPHQRTVPPEGQH